MTDKEYEQKKRECWEEIWSPYREEVFMSDYGREILVIADKVFKAAFDRAYALGKEKETISQKEIEKAADEYARNNQFTHPYSIIATRESYKDGIYFTLGKQEKEAEEGSLWSRLTDEEKREMQCRYHTNECVLRDHRKRTGDKAQSKAVARMKLLESLFGKENLKVENK